MLPSQPAPGIAATNAFGAFLQQHGMLPNNQTVWIDDTGKVLPAGTGPGQIGQCCTLVDVVAILQYLGATGDGAAILQSVLQGLGRLARYQSGGPAPYNEDYVAWPGRPTPLDAATVVAGQQHGLASIHAQTEVCFSPGGHRRLWQALDAGRPVILNTWYAASSNTKYHSIVGYQRRDLDGVPVVDVADPNWINPNTGAWDPSVALAAWLPQGGVWRNTVTATYIWR